MHGGKIWATNNTEKDREKVKAQHLHSAYHSNNNNIF